MDEIILELKKKIEAEGLTQFDVCKAIHCQAASLNRWLLGKAKPSYAWKKLLEEYLKKDVEIKNN